MYLLLGKKSISGVIISTYVLMKYISITKNGEVNTVLEQMIILISNSKLLSSAIIAVTFRGM